MNLLKKRKYLLLLSVLIVGICFFIYPKSNLNFEKKIQHISYTKDYKTILEKKIETGDAIEKEIKQFFLNNKHGWVPIIRSLSSGARFPSITITDNNYSYVLEIWSDEIMIGFVNSKKSYRKKINSKLHSKLISLILNTEKPKRKKKGK